MSGQMKDAASYFCDIEHRSAKAVVDGVQIRTFWGKEMLVSVVDLEAQAVVPVHDHPQEQIGTVISGEIEMIIAGEKRLCKPGDIYIVPANVGHGAKAGDHPVKAIDVFSPVREDYQY